MNVALAAGHLGTFVGVSALVIVTPGQDTALTIRNSLRGGRHGGVVTAAGVSTGQGIWALATSVGLVALLRASEPAFVTLRLLGAAYLVYLGAHALAAAVHGGRNERAHVSPRSLHPRAAYRQGLLSNLGNAKMAVFFTSLLPQFAESFPALLVLGLVFCCLTFVWLSAYAIAVGRARDLLGRSRIRRSVDALTGGVLVVFGLRLGASSS